MYKNFHRRVKKQKTTAFSNTSMLQVDSYFAVFLYIFFKVSSSEAFPYSQVSHRLTHPWHKGNSYTQMTRCQGNDSNLHVKSSRDIL